MSIQSITRRSFLASAAAVCASPAARAAVSDAKTHPNVLLIMTDDQGWGDVHSHGNPLIDTPVMDSIAASGARFDRFYVSPVCAPTRASLLTGRYHMRTGVTGVTRNLETMDAGETTLAEAFQQNGYATGCFGKWHNGAHYPEHPNGQGFDEFFGFCAGHWNNYFDTTLERNGQPVKTKGYITDVLTDAAIEFVESNADQPFFCYVPYNAPHSPWQVPDEYFQKYKAKNLDDKTACAYAMCENIDDNMGRLMKCLQDNQLDDNTLVIFMTDNGPNSDRYNGGMRGRKGSVHEGGVRVPGFIRWNGTIESGKIIDPIAAHIDILPTLMNLCSHSSVSTRPLDGRDLSPLLLDQASDWKDRMIFQTWGNRGAVRTQRWRAVMERGGEWKLFDMIDDPSQESDISADKPDIVNRLKTAFEEWYEEASSRDLSPDPVSIGYDEMKQVVMPGHEALLAKPGESGIDYYGGQGWANDWVGKWTDTEAYPYWEVNIVESADYKIELDYAVSRADAGATIEVEIGGQALEATVKPAHNPDYLPSPDLIERKEVYEKVWKRLTVGNVKLNEGRTQLAVKAISKPGEEVMELKAVVVTKLN